MSDENNHGASANGQEETPQPKQCWGMNLDTYCMLMNLIQVLPGWGWIFATLMWIMNKDNSQEVDRHGKNVVNWIISFAIYILIAGMVNVAIGVFGLALTLMLGIPLFLLGHLSAVITASFMMVIGLAFPITAAIKANNGVLWKYPFSIHFFK